MIEISGVTKRYGPTTVVNRVSLSIPRGGVTALVGPNGAGKSTLLSIIGRLKPSDEGDVRVDGLNVSDTDSATLARRLSILRQGEPGRRPADGARTGGIWTLSILARASDRRG